MDWLSDRIAKLEALSAPELAALYEDVWGKPPRVRHKRWMQKRIAWKEQERKLGGLSKVAKRRLEELMAEIELPLDRPQQRTPSPQRASVPPPGSVLTRDWRGQQIRVLVRDEGFEHDGTVYRTLSAVAKAVTNQHVSGPAFFGLTGRRRGA